MRLELKLCLNKTGRSKQGGFSLIEVLIAMLIATVAIGGLMSLHARNVSQAADNVGLQRAELVLMNAVARARVGQNTLEMMRDDAQIAHLPNASVFDVSAVDAHNQAGRMISVVWDNHDQEAQVWQCTSALIRKTSQSCVEQWVEP